MAASPSPGSAVRAYDPVCGHAVEVGPATLRVDPDTDLCFCSAECLDAFLLNPDAFGELERRRAR